MEEPKGFVCVGASAGGLRSMEAVLSNLTPALPWPVLVAQHSMPDQPSQLREILARATPMKVLDAVEGVAPAAGHVYVGPSSAELGVSPEGLLALRPPVAGRPQRIDHLFSTAAFARPALVIAVVLSGTGSDGAAGSLVVKLNGGTVLVESEASAQYPGMPAAVRQAGAADAVRDAASLARLIAELAGGGLHESSESTDRTLRSIAAILSKETRTDFSGYRLATLRRRAEKRRALAGSATLEEYRDLVERDRDERESLVQSLLIPVTEFLRDPETWRAVEREVLPALVARARAGDPVRVWCAGCATGEEAYTVALLLAEQLDDLGNVEIVGTDLDRTAIAHAKAGVYAPARVRAVDTERLDRFFEDGDGAYAVRSPLRDVVRFEVQDLTRESPDGEFDLVTCRNVLIYFDDALQAKVIDRFRRAMRDDATLLLGRSEAIPKHQRAFRPGGSKLRIFRTAESPRGGTGADEVAAGRPEQRAPTSGVEDAAQVQDSTALLIVVDPSWRITSSNARADEFAGRNLLGEDLLEVFPWRGTPLHDAIRTSSATGRSSRVQGASARGAFLDLTIEPFPPGSTSLLLVGHLGVRAARTSAPGSEGELREELATTNEELQASNEELAATNEELQASNEELASLNEEFQSSNENLAVTNAGLQASVDARTPALLEAMLNSRPGAVIGIGPERRVAICNLAATHLLGARGSTPGEPLDLSALGVARAALDTWLTDARASKDGRVERSEGRLHVVVEHLGDADGATVGWVLTCTQAA